MGGLPANRTVNGFAVQPGDPQDMFVAMRDGLFKSIDAGESWKNVGSGLKNVTAVAINPKKANEMYLSTTDGAIYMSADAGIKWKKQE